MLPSTCLSIDRIVPPEFFLNDLPDRNSIFPKEAVAHIFICITSKKEYFSFSGTCICMYRTSRSVSVVAFATSALRRSLLNWSLYAFPQLSIASNKLVEHQRIVTSASLEAVNLNHDEFYAAFKTFCNVFHVDVNSSEFPFCAFILQGMGEPFDLDKRVYFDMIDAFSNQPIEAITPLSFKQKIAEIKAFYASKISLNIETDIRQLIYTKKGGAISLLAKNLLKAKYKSPKFFQAKKDLKAKFNAEISGILAEVNDLPSQIKIMEQQHIRLKNEWDVFCDNSNETLYELKVSQDKEIEAQYFENGHSRIFDFNQKFAEIGFRLNTLHTRFKLLEENLHASKGNFYEALLKLTKLDEIALDEVHNLIRFYFELSREVTKENELQRHQALHRILD